MGSGSIVMHNTFSVIHFTFTPYIHFMHSDPESSVRSTRDGRTGNGS